MIVVSYSSKVSVWQSKKMKAIENAFADRPFCLRSTPRLLRAAWLIDFDFSLVSLSFCCVRVLCFVFCCICRATRLYVLFFLLYLQCTSGLTLLIVSPAPHLVSSPPAFINTHGFFVLCQVIVIIVLSVFPCLHWFSFSLASFSFIWTFIWFVVCSCNQ